MNGRIEISFDRLLLPESILRQSFVLLDANSNDLTPTVAYDPVSRVVTVTPQPNTLTERQLYTLVIETPSGPKDPNGLRAIDGAYLSPEPAQATHSFTATAASSPPPPAPPLVDYCRDLNRAFRFRCELCHGTGGSPPAEGLELDTPAGIQTTALGRTAQGSVAHESNTGPRASPEPPGLLFAEDVPIIDPGPGPSGTAAFVQNDAGGALGSGDPGHSWLMYKLLTAVPTACDSLGADGYPPCDGGALPDGSAAPPQTPSGLYQVACSDAGDPCPQPMSDNERARLANLVPGREMPFPDSLNTPVDQNFSAFTLDELELVSLWIAQGAPLPTGACNYAPTP